MKAKQGTFLSRLPRWVTGLNPTGDLGRQCGMLLRIMLLEEQRNESIYPQL